MNEDYVSHSLAVALKAAGFDWHCRAVWHYDGSEWNFIEDYASTFQHPESMVSGIVSGTPRITKQSTKNKE